MQDRKAALSIALGVSVKKIRQTRKPNAFKVNKIPYLVLTKLEANKHALDCALMTLYRLDPEFLVDHLALVSKVSRKQVIAVIRELGKHGKRGNGLLLALLKNPSSFKRVAYKQFGRAGLIASDKREISIGPWCIYRVDS